ncbi:hypothetical protein W02_42900 [Nitrospira sp. KM1]|uniref:hypothetical protein n=1 Tax=Nitrospira sp. KM1 TaxID=1936990 RepID=UPI0013A71025|nr:hypothetical protein [Nitrospira sp. KM1]BCA57150.1 hypothetical protein W02_42900 [Nitrospira sp. KM1]
MPKTITQEFALKQGQFSKTGAFDALLDLDSRLFIDPHLLRRTTQPELSGARKTLEEHFTKVLRLLGHSRAKADVFWENAKTLLTFPEVQGLCIGYGKEGTAGSGIGPSLRDRLLKTAKEIIDVGIKDPEIFELVGLFAEDIGPDRISDMTAGIIQSHLKAFTRRVFKELNVKQSINPYSRKPIILVPKEILRPLPIAHDWSDVDIVAAHNEALRHRVNKQVGKTWKHATTRIAKRDLRKALLQNPELIRDLLNQYKSKPTEAYDFDKDPYGEVTWYQEANRLANQLQLALHLSPHPTNEEVLRVVLAICNKFKDAVENHDLARILYHERGDPRHESYAQRLFYAMADAYCEANNLDLSREANAGRGPVDFKVSAGYRTRIVVEIKLSSNSKLIGGFKRQVGEYAKSEKAYKAIYAVLDIGKGGKWRKRLSRAENELKKAGELVPLIFVIDAELKKSASRL